MQLALLRPQHVSRSLLATGPTFHRGTGWFWLLPGQICEQTGLGASTPSSALLLKGLLRLLKSKATFLPATRFTHDSVSLGVLEGMIWGTC